MFEQFGESLVGSPIYDWVNSLFWIWPVLEIFHFIGLSLLMGALIVTDLRLAGHFRAMNPAATHRLIPVAFIGFGINLATGILFFCADPTRYSVNIGFQIKMLLVLLAGLNMLLYYWKVHARVNSWAPDAASPPLARTVAYTSLALWSSVLLLGRLIPYIGTG